jgi:hypothetical protein
MVHKCYFVGHVRNEIKDASKLRDGHFQIRNLANKCAANNRFHCDHAMRPAELCVNRLGQRRAIGCK